MYQNFSLCNEQELADSVQLTENNALVSNSIHEVVPEKDSNPKDYPQIDDLFQNNRINKEQKLPEINWG